MGKHLLILTPPALLDSIGQGLIVEVPLQGWVRGGRIDVGPVRQDLSLLCGELFSLTVIPDLELFVFFSSCMVHDLFFLLNEVVFALHVLLNTHYAPGLTCVRNRKAAGALSKAVSASSWACMRCTSNTEVRYPSPRFMAVCSTMRLWCAMVAIFESRSMIDFSRSRVRILTCSLYLASTEAS